jgi:hypothetical protein
MTRVDEETKVMHRLRSLLIQIFCIGVKSREVRREDPLGWIIQTIDLKGLSRTHVSRPLRQKPQEIMTCSKIRTCNIIPRPPRKRCSVCPSPEQSPMSVLE